MTRHEKLSFLIPILVIGFIMAVYFHYAIANYANQGYPHNTFLFRPEDRFMDFINPVTLSADRDPFAEGKVFHKGGYAPFGYLVSYAFSLIQPIQLSLLLFWGIFLFSFFRFIRYTLFQSPPAPPLTQQVLSIFALTALSYPFLLGMERANFDLLICALLIFFAQLYRNKNPLSFIPLALCIAMKPFLALIALIYLLDRKFSPLFKMGAVVILLNIASLALFKDGLVGELQKYLSEAAIVKQIVGTIPFSFTSDLFSAIDLIFSLVTQRPVNAPNLASSPFASIYLLISLAIILLCCFLLWQKPRPFWQSLAILLILTTVFPIGTHDYRLILLYIPMAEFISMDTPFRQQDKELLALWAFLLIPKNYLVFQVDQNLAMLLNPLLLLLMLVLLLRYPQPSQGISSS
jgi:hypothetical protein